MTQQEQNEFRERWEEAQAWMQAVQERLKLNDNTEGPRAALEARLKETEKIHESEPEGRMKMEVALVAADALLKNGDEELKNQTHSKLKELKTLWEETSTYIIHCHSRIEWVWLHWSEYLKAHEEFYMWLVKVQRVVEPQLELQLALREKLWQVEHHRVTCSNVKAQEPLLERLLDEASTLYNRTQDPSVDEHAQNKLQEAYNNIRTRVEERLALVQKVAEEHQQHQSRVHDFQTWLASKTVEVNRFREMEDVSENRLQALQDLDASVAREEETLVYIEGQAEAVKANTSPAGAELIREEVEELRLEWQRMRLELQEIHTKLKGSMDAQREYYTRREELAAGIKRLRALVHKMSRQLENKDGERSEENMVAQWKSYTDVRTVLSAEEPQVEQLKAQLKELYRFPYDYQQLADEVLTAVKEYQSVKGRTFRLCSESETALKQLLQDPLHVFSQWSPLASQMLDTSAEVTDFSHMAVLVQNIEKLLKDSVQLQERLSLLQVKADLLSAVFGEEKAQSLLEELSTDMKKREQLHSQLLQRRTRLQELISTTKNFGDAYDSIHQKLMSIKERFHAADGLQPDILAKKSQADQLKVIKKDLEDCEAHITALETLVSSSPANRTKFERLYSDWKLLYKAVRSKANESEESILEHESFHESLLNMEKWLMIMRQKLESFRGPNGEWSVVNRQHEAERALGEFPEKEHQLHRTEEQGHIVLLKTSQEGKVHIQRDLRRLRESWMSLHALSLNLYRLLNGHGASGEIDSSLHSHHAADFLEGSGGSSIRVRADGQSGFEDDLQLPEGSRMARGSGGFEAFAKHGKFVTKHDDASQTEDGEFSPRGGILYPDENVQGVWRGEPRGHSTSTDEVDSTAIGRGYQGIGEQKDGGHTHGAGAIRKIGSGNRGRTREWVEEHLSRVEDVGIISEGHYARDSADTAKPSNTDVRPKQLSAFTHVTDASGHGSTDITQVRQRRSDWKSRRREFEAWLRKENEKLAGIMNNQRALSTKELKIRRNTLKGLRAGIPWGQAQFQQLLSSWQAEAGTEDVELEELRYRWMLYKSKLKDAECVKAQLKLQDEGDQQEELVRTRKQDSCCGFLYRVCRVALPLQLLLLALLLFAFLLPMMDEGTSCSLSNNFARSFNIMLRYHGPPPT
ncbi:nesprin-3 isoform X1 [Pangasianodon hypophthalmus]|uniref:nesprin-3 isoform X1 n=1 Tax=Pangasianodon hypophthalmus TaxID=310915 RepID=UPI00230821CD|nr:nesprin-3 isoform X1 [Pangasianodon hypophthalmus]